MDPITRTDRIAAAPSAAAPSLRVAVVEPPPARSGPGRDVTPLAEDLAAGGHEVIVVGWRGGVGDAVDAHPHRLAGPVHHHRVLALARARPDTWVAAGVRLRGMDAVVLVVTDEADVPALSALVTPLSAGEGPHVVVVLPGSPANRRAAPGRLTARLLARAEGVVVVDVAQARLARQWGAQRVRVGRAVGPHSALPTVDLADLRGVGPVAVAAAPTPADRLRGAGGWARIAVGRALGRVRDARRPGRRGRDLAVPVPAWLTPTDVLLDRAEAGQARAWARSARLPWVVDATAAWAAAGAVAVLEAVDAGDRRAVVIDDSGPRSPLARWARSLGYRVVESDLVGAGARAGGLSVAGGSVDLVAQIHPGGCVVTGVDDLLEAAAWALRPGGVVVVTVPLAARGADAFGPAETRALLARAHHAGFELIGDQDGDLLPRMRSAHAHARFGGGPYGLLRLALRRR